ncbi:MAG: hypothetical protein ACI4QM_01050, partial [Alphaproteobacteria bacterium]
MRAMDVAQQVKDSQVGELMMLQGNMTSLGYAVRAWVNETDTNYFRIGLDRVPSGACRHLLKADWKLPTQIYVGDQVYNGDVNICGDDQFSTQIDFKFHKILDGERDPYTECSDPDTPIANTAAEGVCYDKKASWMPRGLLLWRAFGLSVGYQKTSAQTEVLTGSSGRARTYDRSVNSRLL